VRERGEFAAPATGRMKPIDMPLCSHHQQLIHAARGGGREMPAVNSVVESQILAKLTYYKYYNNRAGVSLPSSLQQSIGVWRKRQALSTSSTSQTSHGGLSGRTLSLRCNHSGSAFLQASDYNNGATLIRAGMVRIHFFL